MIDNSWRGALMVLFPGWWFPVKIIWCLTLIHYNDRKKNFNCVYSLWCDCWWLDARPSYRRPSNVVLKIETDRLVKLTSKVVVEDCVGHVKACRSGWPGGYIVTGSGNCPLLCPVYEIYGVHNFPQLPRDRVIVQFVYYYISYNKLYS
jgi:hypothetical protein